MLDRLLSGERLRVQLKNTTGTFRKGPFTVRRLLVLGDYYVTESSRWAAFAVPGGIVIGRQGRYRMTDDEIADWLDGVVEVEQVAK